MGVYSGEFAGKGRANTTPTLAVVFIAVTAISLCTFVSFDHHNH